MSGSEESGFAHASAGLLVGVTWAVTWPDSAAGPLLAPVVAWLVEVFDATVVVLPDDEHDRAVALVSHAPHVLANALLGVVEDAVGTPAARHLVAGSFRDGTRVAGRNARRTRHMLAENADALVDVLDAVVAELVAYRHELGGPGLLARLERVADAGASVRAPEVAWAPCPDLGALLGEHGGQTLLVRAGLEWAAIPGSAARPPAPG